MVATLSQGRAKYADHAALHEHAAPVARRYSDEFLALAAAARDHAVSYVTERCVFALRPEGLELLEVAPGIDIEKDILAHMDFKPIIRGTPDLMDARIFRNELMELRDDMLLLPLEQRFPPWDAARGEIGRAHV